MGYVFNRLCIDQRRLKRPITALWRGICTKEGERGIKGVKLKEAEFCSNVPWLFQVET